MRSFVAASVAGRMPYVLALALLVLFLVLVLVPEALALHSEDVALLSSVTQPGLPLLAIAIAFLPVESEFDPRTLGGIDLISALMILPNATGQLLGRSCAATIRWAVAIGVFCALVGVTTSFYAGTPSGATIVLVAIVCFLVTAAVGGLRARVVRARHERAERHLHEHGPACGHPAVPHGDHVDYLHDGHRHAAHADHWDEHADHADHADRSDPAHADEGVHR